MWNITGIPCLWAALAWQDHAVIVFYVLIMLGIGWYVSQKSSNDEEYFLAGRRMPWFAVGVSIIASILSSITYVADPGEVWRSGETYLMGKMLAIPFEMLFVWVFVIPFFMRFRYTSAYEYLEDRFSPAARKLGTIMFLFGVLTWMGVVVLVLAKAMSDVTEVRLEVVILTVGVVATIYTMLGGVRAVIWTDVIQVGLMLGGAIYVLAFIAWDTNSGLGDWHRSVSQIGSKMPVYSFDPQVRATMVTVGLSMFCWHVCTHVGNQMTVQRYFCTSDVKSARRSFLTGSILGVVINVMLLIVGMALFHYYQSHALPPEIPAELHDWASLPSHERDPAIGKKADELFPRFVVTALPPGIAGAILAAMLAAAMSTIDSGTNSVATVLVAGFYRRHDRDPTAPQTGSALPANHVALARWLTIIVGVITTGAAFGISAVTGHVNIVEMMPRTFNCIPGPMGGMFLAGMFIPRASSRSVIPATLLGLAVSLWLAYSKEFFALFEIQYSFSFTWVMFGSLGVTLFFAWAFSQFESASSAARPGFTWATRSVKPEDRIS